MNYIMLRCVWQELDFKFASDGVGGLYFFPGYVVLE